MSVLIKGMDELPDDGAVLVVMHNNGKVYIKDACTYGYHMEMVKLPEKHGRLGDLDKLWERMLKYIDNEGAKFPYGDDDSLIHRDSACFMIENAPTIIEAEGDEK